MMSWSDSLNVLFGLNFDSSRSQRSVHFENGIAALREGLGEEATASFLIALEQGDGRAGYALGLAALGGGSKCATFRKAASYFQRAAWAGVPEACFELGKLMEGGLGVQKNRRNAFRYFLRAALLGHVDSHYEVARHYQEGIGVKRDVLVARMWRGRGNELVRGLLN